MGVVLLNFTTKKDHTHSIASLFLQAMELIRKHWLVPSSSADLV
jgi:hypothetical protein